VPTCTEPSVINKHYIVRNVPAVYKAKLPTTAAMEVVIFSNSIISLPLSKSHPLGAIVADSRSIVGIIVQCQSVLKDMLSMVTRPTAHGMTNNYYKYCSIIVGLPS
jgi:hypothetical protein